MLSTTPQERLALGVISLLVSAGVGARLLHREPPATLSGGAGEQREAAALGELRAGTEARAAEAARRARPLAEGERLDPNTAPAEELDRLPHLGPAQAARIVAWREAHGPFRTLGDLDAVPGIGAAALAALAPHVTLAPGPQTATLEGGGGPSRAAPGAPAAAPLLDLNRATAQELQTLPGVGPALAARIVEYRDRHGPFGSPAELEKVRGIGPATATRMAPRLTTTP